MAYRSRKQDRDQEIARRIEDSYRLDPIDRAREALKGVAQVDPATAEVLRQNPNMTWSEAIDEVIRAELAELAG